MKTDSTFDYVVSYTGMDISHSIAERINHKYPPSSLPRFDPHAA